MRFELKTKMDSGQADFEKCSLAMAAVDSAENVVEKAHSLMNN